ncbi:MAG: hypothetical protein KKC76_21205 [Proteobacteria bacterium]|nr:hypothetical protein [Pseudomonadota bacterium]
MILSAIKHHLWMAVGRHSLLLPLVNLYAAFSSRDLHVVDHSTDLVIEGYPRSANTTGVAIFLLVSDNSLRIAHHVHGPAQFLYATRWNIPALLLLRQPLEAVASLLIRYPALKPAATLRDYIYFHEPLIAIADQFVVADFQEIVDDPDGVITKVNRKYGLDIPTLETKKITTFDVNNLVEIMDKRDRRADVISETTVARPSKAREQKKIRVLAMLRHSQYQNLIDRAETAYYALMEKR